MASFFIITIILLIIVAFCGVIGTYADTVTTTSAIKYVAEWNKVQNQPQIPNRVTNKVHSDANQNALINGGRCDPNRVVYHYPAGPQGKKWVWIRGYSGGTGACPPGEMLKLWQEAIEAEGYDGDFKMIAAETFDVASFNTCLDGDQLKCRAQRDGCGIECNNGVACQEDGQCGGLCITQINGHGHSESLCRSSGFGIRLGFVVGLALLLMMV